MDKPLAINLMGPTASGKTALAIELRKHLPVELINVDSTQVYCQLNIGSAKPDADTLARVPHRLLDIRDPAQSYSAADFLADARREMADICASGRIPLLVGGSMMYFKVLLEGLSQLPAANQQIRDTLELRAQRDGWPSLYEQLAEVDPETASRLHPNHSQRIQRALEVYLVTGTPMSALQTESVGGLSKDYNFRQISLIPQNRKLLHKRIEQRFQSMMELGFVREVEQLYNRGDLHINLPAIRAVGYRQLWNYWAGEYSLEAAVKKGVVATRQLAKRQMTWLRSWPGATTINIDNEKEFFSIKEICKQSLQVLK